MRRVIPVFIGLLLSGCFDYEAYQRSAAVETCEFLERCGLMFESSIQECVDENTEDIYANATCENYNADAARACVEEISEIDCGIGGLADMAQLDVCSGVCTN